MFEKIQMILMMKTGISNNRILRLNNNASEFLDIIYSGDFVAHITSLTRLTSMNRTLIDNKMSNVILKSNFRKYYEYNI